MNHFHLLFPPCSGCCWQLWVHCGEVLRVQAFCRWDSTEGGFSTMCAIVFHHWGGGWLCRWGFEYKDGWTLMRLLTFKCVVWIAFLFLVEVKKITKLLHSEFILFIFFPNSFPTWFYPSDLFIVFVFCFCLQGNNEVLFYNLTFNEMFGMTSSSQSPDLKGISKLSFQFLLGFSWQFDAFYILKCQNKIWHRLFLISINYLTDCTDHLMGRWFFIWRQDVGE